MDGGPTSAAGNINLGAAAYREGRIADARAYFVRALLADADNERAWLWLATVSDDPEEQRYCLNRALEINPESSGLRRLVLLPAGNAAIPPELIELEQPPLPPDLAEAGKVGLPILPRTALERRHRAAAKGREPDKAVSAPPSVLQPDRWRKWAWLLPLLGVLLLLVGVYATIGNEANHLERDAYVIAYAGPLTGPEAAIGEEQLRSVEMAVAELNARGGINGRVLEVLSYDDGNDPALGEQRAQEIVGNDRVLLVIGHDRSEVSLAAAPIYAAAGLPAITPSSTADVLTETDPWYFRSVFTNKREGELIAAYAQHALKFKSATIVTTAGPYESSLAKAFAAQFSVDGTVLDQLLLDPANLDASVAKIVDELGETADPGIVFLAIRPEDARVLLLTMRRAGIDPPMIGGEALGYGDFADLFEDEPEEAEQPGFFTNNLFAVSPMIYDSLGGEALAYAQRYRAQFGSSPEWFGAKAFDAVTLAAHAISSVTAPATGSGDIAAQRVQVRDALDALNSLDHAVPGLSGPLYFDSTRSVPQALSFGKFDLGSLLSAPLQYRAVVPPTSVDLDAARAAGLTFALEGETFLQYRVVYVGVDINEISNLNVQEQTYDADFFIWFRYQGDKSAEDIFFINATDPELALPDALDRTETGNNHFAMFRVDSNFTEPMDFEDYPWDKHILTVSLQNVLLSQDEIVYVPDQSNIRQPQEQRLRSGVDFTEPFNRIPSWIANRVFYAQGTATSRSTTPDPRTGSPEYDTVSTYEVQMSYTRDVRPFLVKNLLPLALLALVTYISLYFNPANASTRIGFSITAILTTSVLLQSIASNLPDIGYTVAIEWGYYVYIALSALLVLVNITIERWYKAKRYAAVEQLDRIARIAYPLVLLSLVAAYAIHFG